MKRFCTILLMCFLMSVFSTDVKAQIVKGECFMGLNLSQVYGDGTNGYKRFGLHGGLGALVPIYSQGDFDIEFSLEIAFNQRGAHDNSVAFHYDADGDGTIDKNYHYGKYDLYMNYMEIPMLFYFSDKQIYSLGLGASYGRLIGLREYELGESTDIDINTGYENGGYKQNDFCVLIDGKVRLHERLKLGVRFQYSMFSIRERYDLYEVNKNINFDNTLPKEEIDKLRPSQRPTQYNNNVSIRLIYVFNEDRSQYIYDEYRFTGDNPKIHQKAIDKELKKLKKKQAKEAKKSK